MLSPYPATAVTVQTHGQVGTGESMEPEPGVERDRLTRSQAAPKTSSQLRRLRMVRNVSVRLR